MRLTIYTDGGSLNNPGEAAYGFLVYEGNTLLHKDKGRIGIASNNVAEYTGLIKALEYVRAQVANRKSQIKSITAISDSQLMVKQLNGEYKVKHQDIKPLHSHIKMLEMQIGTAIHFKHVLREENQEADALVKEALGK